MFQSNKSEEKKSNQDDTREIKKNPKMIFEDRIQGLRKKGKMRGKRYSYIGIIASLAIFISSMIMGYILFEQIGQITKKVSVANIKNNFQDVIDPDMRCKTSCCLASLEKIRKYKYKEVNSSGECDPMYEIKRLQCDSSLSWCELIPNIVQDNIEVEKKDISEQLNKNEIDTDDDGLSDEKEAFLGTDMNNQDTDGDGFFDGDEVKNGFDPKRK